MKRIEEDHSCVWRDQVEKLKGIVLAQNALIEKQAQAFGKQREQLIQNTQTVEDLKTQFAVKIEALSSEVKELKRQRFGRSSEKVTPIKSELNAERVSQQERDQAWLKTQQKRAETRKKKLSLKERKVFHPVPNDLRVCKKCGKELKALGTGKSSTIYEYVPAAIERQTHIRETLSCSCGECIVTAPGPRRVLDKTSYGPGLIAQLISSKCSDSIPLYRLKKQFRRLKAPLSESTMNRLYHEAAFLLTPIYNKLKENLSAQDIVQADETPLKSLEKSGKTKGKAQTGYIWTFLSEDPKTIIYSYSPSRSGQTASEILGASAGTLVVDAYTGYNQVTKPGGRDRQGCWSHARRKFFRALEKEPELAKIALDFCKSLFRVEHSALEQGISKTEKHQELRQQRSKAILEEFKEWLEAQKNQHLPEGPMGKAIRYCLNQWEFLTHFLSDAKIPIHNNASENALRIVALGRKNFLFVGNTEAGKRQAVLYSLVQTCEALGINPQAYLADVLSRIKDHPANEIENLLPQTWKPPPKSEELSN